MRPSVGAAAAAAGSSSSSSGSGNGGGGGDDDDEEGRRQRGRDGEREAGAGVRGGEEALAEVLFGGTPVEKGELCCLVLASKPWAPFAVGRFAASSADFLHAGMRGPAVYVLHHEGDALWEMGSRTPAPDAPPSSLAAALREQEDAAAARPQQRRRRRRRPGGRQGGAPRGDSRLQRKAQKALRQVEDLKQRLEASGGGAADSGKLAREGRCGTRSPRWP